jgi:tRNA dimethylallyltransferase
MLQFGALEEVRALAERQLDSSLPAMKAHGVPWLIRHLKGELTMEEAVASALMDTRRYAKRQLTWFRNQMKDWSAVPAAEAEAEIARQLAAP